MRRVRQNGVANFFGTQRVGRPQHRLRTRCSADDASTADTSAGTTPAATGAKAAQAAQAVGAQAPQVGQAMLKGEFEKAVLLLLQVGRSTLASPNAPAVPSPLLPLGDKMFGNYY